ncbi:hypothetical protein CES86_1645 [Brucella lupini]|uniref:Uncharacterized protein n=1 Tax=Brucella lupini TaxID=255457 RepID=A0A256GT74_9HYPH|nr:hypothetical protein CES86_1645 [Brucella lupini]
MTLAVTAAAEPRMRPMLSPALSRAKATVRSFCGNNPEIQA